MKNKIKSLLSSLFVLTLTVSLLTVGGGSAWGFGATSSALAAGANVKARQNNAGSVGLPLDKSAKGAKVFGADSSATLVLDEKGVTPTAGGLASLEIGVSGGSAAACYLLVYDSSVAADTTESGSAARLLVPPFIGVTSLNQVKEFLYPKQFHKGLVVLVSGTDPTHCKATIGWLTNGGTN